MSQFEYALTIWKRVFLTCAILGSILAGIHLVHKNHVGFAGAVIAWFGGLVVYHRLDVVQDKNNNEDNK